MNVTAELLRSLGTDRKAFEARAESIVALLQRSDHAVEQAIARIHDKQTEDERRDSETKHHNGVGFQACDARLGSYLARLVKSGRRLYPAPLERARRMALKYKTQLTVLSFLKDRAKLAASENGSLST